MCNAECLKVTMNAPLCDVAQPPATASPGPEGLLRERTAEVVMLTRELVQVQDLLAAMQADMEQLRATSSGETEELRRRLADSEARANEHRRNIEQLRATSSGETEELRRRLADSEARADEHRLHVDALLASTSWRVTAPLRTIVTRLRQLTRL